MRARDLTYARLKRKETAMRRWNADRPSAVGRERQGSQARRDGRRCSAAGRTRRQIGAPGVARRPEQWRTDNASTVGKFRHVGLAKNDDAGLAETGDRGFIDLVAVAA